MRPIILHPKARDAIRRFPKEARVRLGKGLFRLQMGEQLAMPSTPPLELELGRKRLKEILDA